MEESGVQTESKQQFVIIVVALVKIYKEKKKGNALLHTLQIF